MSGERVLKEGDALLAPRKVQLGKFGGGTFGDGALLPRHAREQGVVKDDQLPVFGKVHVRLDGIPMPYGVFKCRKTVFGIPFIVQAAVRDGRVREKIGKFHAYIVANRRKDFNSGCKIFINFV